MEAIQDKPLKVASSQAGATPHWQVLDPMAFEPDGQIIIEASAGTGKTFALVWIYLRLLLGLQTGRAKPRLPKEILIITFTVAATAELRKRVKQALSQLQQALETTSALVCADAAVRSIYDSLLEYPERKPWVALCLEAFDEAAICTLHSFCGQVLKRWAFETGELPPPSQLSENPQPFESGCSDYWHQQIADREKAWASGFLDCFPTPQSVLSYLRARLASAEGSTRHAEDPKKLFFERQIHVRRELKSIHDWIERAPLSAFAKILSEQESRGRRIDAQQWIERFQAWSQLCAAGHLSETLLVALDQTRVLLRESIDSVRGIDTSGELTEISQALNHLAREHAEAQKRFCAHAWDFCQMSLLPQLWEMGIGGFDDLIRQTSYALERFPSLAQKLQQAYPYALVDEFQDTDDRQYQMLRRIYANDYPSALILIGDPKQAIYGFRGATLKTYFVAVSQSQQHYRLSVNWRACAEMVAANNRVWSATPNAFFYAQLPFVPSIAGLKPLESGFFHLGDRLSAMELEWLQTSDGAPILQKDYLAWMAQHCAETVESWLNPGTNADTFLLCRGETRSLQPTDIAILVRSAQEARQIQSAFAHLGRLTSYSGQTHPLFQGVEAHTLLRVLQAIWIQDSAESVFGALTEPFFGLSDCELVERAQGFERQKDIEIFIELKKIWQTEGIYALFRQIVYRYGLLDRWSRRSEITPMDESVMYQLVEKLVWVEKRENAPLRTLAWLERHVEQGDADDTLQRRVALASSETPLIQLTTIHKAKGLEYPVVWLPFAARALRVRSTAATQDLRFQSACDSRALGGSEASGVFVDTPFAEETRLLYVAMTRASLHCRIGLGATRERASQRTQTTSLHRSPIGRLIQGESAQSAQQFLTVLHTIACPEVKVNEHTWQGPRQARSTPPVLIERAVPTEVQPSKGMEQLNFAPLTQRELDQVGSYSAIMHATPSESSKATETDGLGQSVVLSAWDKLGESLTNRACKTIGRTNDSCDSPSDFVDFPRGSAAGTFLHELLEKGSFQQVLSVQWFETFLESSEFSVAWGGVLQKWWGQLMVYPWSLPGPRLYDLDSTTACREFAFTCAIPKRLSVQKLDTYLLPLLHSQGAHDPPHLTECGWKGLLKGFIDLVFKWQGRYYLADYKSNWLGASIEDYDTPSLLHSVAMHRYDLQYALYTLAMHRYLRGTLPHYDYDKDFGGVFYLFLRGIGQTPSMAESVVESPPGIFFYKLPAATLAAIDKLMSR